MVVPLCEMDDVKVHHQSGLRSLWSCASRGSIGMSIESTRRLPLASGGIFDGELWGATLARYSRVATIRKIKKLGRTEGRAAGTPKGASIRNPPGSLR
jgi:hypothetical protein